MGKRIITQRRGRGTSTYKAPSHRYKHKITYPVKDAKTGRIINIINDTARSAPLAVIGLDDNSRIKIPAPINIKQGDQINFTEIKPGHILKLKDIPEGTQIYNIEKIPNSHGTFCRAAGTSARVLTKTNSSIFIQLPSKKKKEFHPECRATIGEIAGTGRLEKPILKAGKKHHIMKARGRLYPRTSGVAMNAVDHPFGCGRGRHVGKSKIPPRNAPPGRNVGLIRARRTGKRK